MQKQHLPAPKSSYVPHREISANFFLNATQSFNPFNLQGSTLPKGSELFNIQGSILPTCSRSFNVQESTLPKVLNLLTYKDPVFLKVLNLLTYRDPLFQKTCKLWSYLWWRCHKLSTAFIACITKSVISVKRRLVKNHSPRIIMAETAYLFYEECIDLNSILRKIRHQTITDWTGPFFFFLDTS